MSTPEYNKSYYKNHAEELKIYARKWRKANPEKVRQNSLGRKPEPEKRRKQYLRYIAGNLFRAVRMRAKREGLPFNLEKSDIIIPTHCPVLGIELKCGKEKAANSSPSVDKVLPELGYTKGNVHVISLRANRLKSDATPEELLKISEYVRTHINA